MRELFALEAEAYSEFHYTPYCFFVKYFVVYKNGLTKTPWLQGVKSDEGLDQATLCKGYRSFSSHNEMVKKADIDERKNLFKASGDRLVCLGRFYGPRRVVVENNKSGRIKFQSPLQNDTRVNGRAIDSAIEQFFSGNDPVTVIKKNRSKDFILPICEKKL